MDPVFEFVFLATTGFTLLVLWRRLRALERGAGPAAPAAEDAAAGDTPSGPAMDADMDTWALLVSPLATILNECELARGQRRMGDRMEVIEKQALRMRDLLERHPHAEKRINSDVEALEPGPCIRAAVDSYAGLAKDRDVGVHLMVEATPMARTNSRLLNRALRHLIRTAITSAPAGRGDVTAAVGLLPAEGDPTHVAFAVADDGPGIEPARLVRILDSSIEEETEPTAEELAYSVVYALAKAMGAQFVMDSAPGTGTRATLKVPLHAAARREADAIRQASAAVDC